ncbi:MAG TPA: quinate 5-dehydrogenase [bacterium]|mgnify:FL=1|nr:quinate 5-dehydrogenase [bacterium]
MKRIVSISLGSSKRDHRVSLSILGEEVIIERIGTDGDIDKAIEKIRELDGKVSAIGLGGIDLYFTIGNKRYVVKDALKMAKAAVKTPVVDGSLIKDTLEKQTVKLLSNVIPGGIRGKNVLLPSAVDRFGMAEAFHNLGANILIGDLMFALGIPIPIYSIKLLKILAYILLPVLTRLPFYILYPVGEKQEKNTPKFTKYFIWADIIAGDFIYIKKYMPERLEGKVIFTNTVTSGDKEMLKERGVRYLITTTPELGGRSFGTNVLEGFLVAMQDKRLPQESDEEFLERIGFKPRVEIPN